MFDIVSLSLSRVTPARVPPGRALDLPGRGETFVWDVPGPPEAPTLLLLHGLSVTGCLNWFPAFESLAARFRVVAMDLRGHGRGIPLGGRFRLSDCADDAAALADVLGIERLIPVGYSLGGPIAQLMWRRHPGRVDGLVLCATSRNFGGTRRERWFYASLMGGVGALWASRRWRQPARAVAGERGGAAAGETGGADLAETGGADLADEDGRRIAAWAFDELRLTSPSTLLQALNAMGRFSSHSWVGQIDVPTAVVVTTRDTLISPARQIKLARAIPGATLHPAHADHAACVLGARRFVPALVEACESVARRLPPRPALSLASPGSAGGS